MKPTNRQLTLLALKSMGLPRPCGSSRYECFDLDHTTLYVGKAGALRSGRTISDSITLTGTLLHRQLILMGEQLVNMTDPDRHAIGTAWAWVRAARSL